MVKKLILTIITSIYMMLTCGFAMDVHFCMGSKVGVDFYKTENEKCGKCGMTEKKGGCCRDEVSFHKLTVDHAAASHVYVDHVLEFDAIFLPQYFISVQKAFNTTTLVSHAIHAPPNIQTLPLFIRNQVFRI